MRLLRRLDGNDVVVGRRTEIEVHEDTLYETETPHRATLRQTNRRNVKQSQAKLRGLARGCLTASDRRCEGLGRHVRYVPQSDVLKMENSSLPSPDGDHTILKEVTFSEPLGGVRPC